MTAMSLLVQSALLVLVAYFLGAWLGCVLRRLTARGRAETVAAAAAGATGAAAATQTSDRFNKALAGQGETAASAPAPAIEPVAPTIQTIAERPTAPAPDIARPRDVGVEATPVNSSSEAGVVSARVYVASETPASEAAPEPKRDDFSLIRGIDDAAQDVLAAAGIRSFAALGALKADEVRGLDETLGRRGRIARENWIEQAQMLATGKTTTHARRRGDGAGIPLAVPSADEGTPLTITAAAGAGAAPGKPTTDGAEEEADAAGLVAAASAAAAMTPEPVQPEPAAPLAAVTPAGETTSISPDEDLQRIAGITPEIDGQLKARGIRRYSQIAGWSSRDVELIEAFLGVPGRVADQNWIGQARTLAGEAEPATPAPDDGAAEATDLLSGVDIAPTTNLVGLRSVKSPAFTGGQTELPARTGQPADLKRIRGIGVMIEKKLHMLGIHSYEQIANWTRSDIDRVSNELDFKGRIERENWVEQARILVAGGQTSFSRRFDGGSATSRAPGEK